MLPSRAWLPQNFSSLLLPFSGHARIAAEIATRLGAPSVIGELSAGIVLGPSVLGWIEPTEVIRLMAEIGIILLLFEVGLETDIGRLAKAGRKSVVVAIGGFVLPFFLGYTTARYLFDTDNIVAMFIGGTLTATSIGITVRILRDVGRQSSREGQIVLGAAVIDDLLGRVVTSGALRVITYRQLGARQYR